MASLIPGYEYDLFISYRQKDNKYDGWVTEFVDNLKKELESTFKEEISVYFDINPHDGLLETHDVDASLKNKLNSLVFIPIISQTYCDPKSFAWEHEFKAFVEQASHDQFGLKVKLPDGNVASRVLPVRIHDLDMEDIKLCESILSSVLRGIEFIYKEPGVNRPLKPDDNEKLNLNKTKYRNQINKIANAIKDLINGIIHFGETPDVGEKEKFKEIRILPKKNRSKIITVSFVAVLLIIACLLIVPRIIHSGEDLEKSIAVLPFRNDSPEDSTQYFMDGVMEELLNSLQTIKSLTVCGRTSVEQYRGQNKTIPEIARELGVNYIIEGSGQKSGNSLRMRVQLIETENNKEKHIWANSFEQENLDLKTYFKTQTGFAESIAKELNAALTGQEKELLDKVPTESLMAYEDYLRGKYYVYKSTQEDLDIALECFDQAKERDPEFALTYVGIGLAWTFRQQLGMASPEEAGPKIMEAIGRAMELDSMLKEVHFIQAAMNVMGMWDWKAGESEYKKAIEINPNYAEAHALYSQLLIMLGQKEEAKEHIELALKLDPHNEMIKIWYSADLLFLQQYEDCILVCREIFEKNPTQFIVLDCLSNALHMEKRYDEAFEASRLFWSNYYKDFNHAFDQYERLGYAETMNLEADTLLAQSKTKYVSPGDIAVIYILAGNKEKTLDCLEKAYEIGDPNIPYTGIRPTYGLLRDEPRYKELLRKLNLPDNN
jgi:TolB-like protein